MLFHSIEFVAFWLITLLAMQLTRRVPAWQVRLLLAASCVFYMWWNPAFLLLIAASTAVDYFVALRIEATPDRRLRTRLLLVSLVFNLGLLGIFKYLDFFIASAEWVGRTFDPSLALGRAELTLPVGISFYTFQTLSYTIEVHRGKLSSARSFERFALFVTYFPQLVAGPIIRADHFLPQLQHVIRVTASGVRRGLPLFYAGLVKKVVVADNVGPYVDMIYADPAGAAPAAMLWATILFAIQIYCDFSGYTDMAIGISRTFGFEIPDNFAHPYHSESIREFWRRWHISLSTWLRDYLYIPLGGSRRGSIHTTYALMMTMLLGGLWHGASWNFVLWGAYHGVLLAVNNQLARRWPSSSTRSVVRLGKIAFTLLLTLFGWGLFRAQRADQLLAVTGAFFSATAWRALPAALPDGRFLFAAGFFVLLHLISERLGGLGDRLTRVSLPVAAAAAAGALTLVALFWPSVPAPFVYFQF